MPCMRTSTFFTGLFAESPADFFRRPNRFIPAILMLAVLTGVARGQATYSVGCIPVTAVINTGLTERTGDIYFTQVVGSSAAGTINISYGVPITVDSSAIVVSAPAGSGYATATPIPGDGFVASVTVIATNSGAGILVLSVPGGINAGSFSVSGVRVAMAGTGLSSLTANVGATGNAITAGQTNVMVISSIAPGIASIETTATGSIDPTTGEVTAQPVITVKEGFLNAWGDASNATNAGIRITLSQAPPTGVSIVFSGTASTNGTGSPTFTTMAADGTIIGSPVEIISGSTSRNVYYRVTSTTDPTMQETLSISPSIQINSSEISLPLPELSITYTISLAPIGTAFDSNGNVITVPQLIPRYVLSEIGPAPLVITSAKKRHGQLISP